MFGALLQSHRLQQAKVANNDRAAQQGPPAKCDVLKAGELVQWAKTLVNWSDLRERVSVGKLLGKNVLLKQFMAEMFFDSKQIE